MRGRGGRHLPATRAEAAVTASVAATNLAVNGDGLDNQITVRVVAGDATRIEVLDGATVVGSFLRATFTTISVNAMGGNDVILMSRANGTFTEVGNAVWRRRQRHHHQRQHQRYSAGRRR